MNNDRLPRKSYNMLYNLDLKGKNNWASNVRLFLFELGLGYAWEYQGVGEETVFVKTIRQRLIDCRWQNWQAHIQTSKRFEMYRNFSTTHLVKSYLLFYMDRHMQLVLAKFRLGISQINVHSCRYKNVNNVDLLCPLCQESNEDEIHFVLKCPFLNNLRVRFIPKKFYAMPCLFRFCLLMASNDEKIVRKLALYLYKAFQFRETVLS